MKSVIHSWSETYLRPRSHFPHDFVGFAIGCVDGTGFDLRRLLCGVTPVRDRIGVRPSVSVHSVARNRTVLHTLTAAVGTLEKKFIVGRNSFTIYKKKLIISTAGALTWDHWPGTQRKGQGCLLHLDLEWGLRIFRRAVRRSFAVPPVLRCLFNLK